MARFVSALSATSIRRSPAAVRRSLSRLLDLWEPVTPPSPLSRELVRSAAALDGPAQAGTEQSYGRLTWVDVSLPVEIPGATTHPNDLHTSDVEWAGLANQGPCGEYNCVAAAMAMMLAVLVLHACLHL